MNDKYKHDQHDDKSASTIKEAPLSSQDLPVEFGEPSPSTIITNSFSPPTRDEPGENDGEKAGE
ncbi:hypothetical protein F2074_18370 [Salmonella enterica]|nr:hypothetical protein [Salmonella enterica]